LLRAIDEDIKQFGGKNDPFQSRSSQNFTSNSAQGLP
jgi:hypothetical protein